MQRVRVGEAGAPAEGGAGGRLSRMFCWRFVCARRTWGLAVLVRVRFLQVWQLGSSGWSFLEEGQVWGRARSEPQTPR